MGNPSDPSRPNDDFSLVLGGPLYQLFLRTRLVKPPMQLLYRRIVVLTLLAWLPLFLFSVLEGTAWSGVSVPFFNDLVTQARFLIALPMLIAAELIVHQRIRPIVEQFAGEGVIPPEEKSRFQDILKSTLHWRNSLWIEIFFLILTFTLGHWIWRNYTSMRVETWYMTRSGESIHLGLAGYWYAFVAVPLFQFILLRWYFRLFLWYRFLWKVSRLKLRLIPVHPDRAAGLGFLGLSIGAFIPILLAHAVLFAAFIGGHILNEGANLLNFQMEILTVVLILMLMAFAPLTFFSMKLWEAKRLGLREFGTLGSRYAQDFETKWIQKKGPHGETLLGTSDIQSLADLANSFEVVRRMHLVPFTNEMALRLAIVLLIPYFPLILTLMPLEEMIKKSINILL